MDQHMSRRHFMKVAAGATALATSVEASASLLEPTDAGSLRCTPLCFSTNQSSENADECWLAVYPGGCGGCAGNHI